MNPVANLKESNLTEEQLQELEAEISAQQQVAVRTSFLVDDMNVKAIDEERFPDDFPIARFRGKVKTPASLSIGFTQATSIQAMVPLAEGQFVPAVIKTVISEHVAEGMLPDNAIELGKWLVEEGERVKATMKEQPLIGDRLRIASQGDVAAVARSLDPEQIAGQHNGGN